MYKMKKMFLYSEIAEIEMRTLAGSRRTILDIKTNFFLKLNPFSLGK